MAKTIYKQGLHDLGGSVYAYMQPDGSWGVSNAGLIADSGTALLVDTLFDLTLTQRMLDEMRNAVDATIETVVNTHANGDHCWGNQLLGGSRIIASKIGAAEMTEIPPGMLAQLMRAAPTMGLLGQYLSSIFGAFDFEGIVLTGPTEVFEDAMSVHVGDTRVELIEVGPAHTRGDIIVHVPAQRVVFTGDILFNEGHPIIWAGPVESWIAACQRILELDIDIVVPGHGPLADKQSVARMKTYLEHLLAETRTRYEAGLSVAEAARDIALTEYDSWTEPERIYVNVATIYRHLGATEVPASVVDLFAGMAQIAHARGLYGLS